MAVVVMLCFARSGGTVLNQCLGCLPNVVILSEVNPLGGGWGSGEEPCDTVQLQAKQWYGIDLVSDGFADGVLELDKICQKQGKQLVIRDWSFINFFPRGQNGFDPPNKFLSIKALQGRCGLHVFGIVRDAIDVCLSYGAAKLRALVLFSCYRNYVAALLALGCPIFKYEDFCQNPHKTLQNICRHIGTEYNESFLQYMTFKNVNGDVQSKGKSRGVKQGKITPLARKIVDIDKIAAINADQNMKKTNMVLGYPNNFIAGGSKC